MKKTNQKRLRIRPRIIKIRRTRSRNIKNKKHRIRRRIIK